MTIRMAKCHPDRPVKALDMCNACYLRDRYQNVESFREKRRADSKAWHDRNADHARSLQLRRYYGITLADYRALFVGQRGLCAVCEERLPDEGRRQPTRNSNVEHDHATGVVRGIVHRRCNFAIAMYEQTGLMRKVASYIERHGLRVIDGGKSETG